MQESIERDALLAKKNRKQRRKAEQDSVKAQKLLEVDPDPPELPEQFDDVVEEDDALGGEKDLDLGAFDPIDFDDIRGAW